MQPYNLNVNLSFSQLSNTSLGNRQFLQLDDRGDIQQEYVHFHTASPPACVESSDLLIVSWLQMETEIQIRKNT